MVSDHGTRCAWRGPCAAARDAEASARAGCDRRGSQRASGQTPPATQAGRISQEDHADEETHDRSSRFSPSTRGCRRFHRPRADGARRVCARGADGCRPHGVTVHLAPCVGARLRARPRRPRGRGRRTDDAVVGGVLRRRDPAQPARHRRDPRGRRRRRAPGRGDPGRRARRGGRTPRHRRPRRLPLRVRDHRGRQPRAAVAARGRARGTAPGRRADGARRNPVREHPQRRAHRLRARRDALRHRGRRVGTASRPGPGGARRQDPARGRRRLDSRRQPFPARPSGASATATRRGSGGMPRAPCTRRSSVRTRGTS